MTTRDTTPLALVPAAGFARRLGAEIGTKAAIAIGSRWDHEGGHRIVEPLAGCLLDSLGRAGIAEGIVLRRAQGWDLAARLAAGTHRGLRLTYLVVPPTRGVPYTLARAAPLARGRVVALGFPDVLFEPRDAFARMLRRQARSGAAVVLGLFPTATPWRTDMVVLDDDGRPLDLVLTPAETTLRFAWLLAVWTPEMTAFLERWVESPAAATIAAVREPRMGDVVRAALAAGMAIETEAFPEGSFFDVATPEDLAEARARFEG